MIVIGLTGSIGMGKSTTAGMFADEGAMIWNADDIVHALYSVGGAAVAPVDEAFPGVVVNRSVDRARLAQALGTDKAKFRKLEDIVHPLVLAGRLEMLAEAAGRGVRLAVLDSPLFFETGSEAAVDAVIVVTADAETQAERVLARPGMTRERFDAIRERQMPDAEKRRRADFLVDTGHGLDAARTQVRRIVRTVLAPGWTGRWGPLPSRAEATH